MSFFDRFRVSNIDRGVEEYSSRPGAVLLDVRTPQEYSEGHIPGSKNIPLQTLESIEREISDRNIPLYVYCRSGGRSGMAAGILGSLGYSNVKNIGGIMNYSGELAG